MRPTSATRRLLVVLAVATALCADQAVMASASSRPQTVEIASIATRLVNRLANNFKRTLPGVIRPRLPERRSADSAVAMHPAATDRDISPISLSPFQFRLPPPAV